MKLVSAIILDANETLEKLTLLFETASLLGCDQEYSGTPIDAKKIIARNRNHLGTSKVWRISSIGYGFADSSYYVTNYPQLPHLTLEQWLRACEVNQKPKRRL